MNTRIIFNGKTYTDPSDMPAEVRQAYQKVLGLLEDANTNGIPDVLEAAGLGNVISIQQSHVIVNGQSYDRPEEMPPAVRQLYDRALSQVGAARNDPPRPLGSPPSIEISSGRGPSGGLSRILLLVGAVILGFLLVALLSGGVVAEYQP